MPNTKSKRGNLDRLKKLEEKFRKALQELSEATAEELPLGTILEATLGNSRIRGEVISHPISWSTYRAGEVNVRNLKTGKTRSVDPNYTSQNVTVISLPTDH